MRREFVGALRSGPQEGEVRAVKMKMQSKRKSWQSSSGSALLIAMFLTMILTLLGLAFALTSLTDATITNSNRQGLSTYYVAEAGGEEAMNQLATTPRAQFNPNKYAGTFPVDVTKCFYNDSNAPACPAATVTTNATLVSVPVSVGTGRYSPNIQYMGRQTNSLNIVLHRFLVATSATQNAAGLKASQNVVNQVFVEDPEFAFPPHPLTSCLEPSGSGPWRPHGVVPSGVTEVPAPPAKWPGTNDDNYGTTPYPTNPPGCADPKATRIQAVFQANADYSYATDITDSANLPPQFWKTAPSGNPADPETGVPYRVYVDGNLTVNGNTTIHGVYFVTGNVTFNGSAKLDGIVYAPYGSFSGNGGGNPSVPDTTGGIFAKNISSTGNHYYVLWNPQYTKSFIGQIPYRLARGGR